LHQKYTKSNISKALEKLVEDESLFGKVYGKTTVYSVKQKTAKEAGGEEGEEGGASSTTENLDSLSKNISELTEKHAELVIENKKLDQGMLCIYDVHESGINLCRIVFAGIKSEPTTDETRELLEKLTREVKLCSLI
jgi:hypothetical protein